MVPAHGVMATIALLLMKHAKAALQHQQPCLFPPHSTTAASSCAASSVLPSSSSASISARRSTCLNLAAPSDKSMQQQEQQPPVPLLTWSRDAASREGYSDQLTSHPIVRTAKILSLSAANDPANAPLHHGALPEGAELIQIASSVNDLDVHALQQAGVNTIFVSHAVDALADLLHQLPLVQWVHTRSAGVDFIYSAALASWQQQQQHHIMTNARGQFSSTLAEYTMAACSYFAKDFNRLKRNQRDKNWDRYSVLELRGATLGIVGYGDIGRTTARLAKTYGMKVLALTRRKRAPSDVDDDPWVDELLDDGGSSNSLNRVFAESDYILCALPLTPATRNMIGAEQFSVAKQGSVFINVGRGPVVNEEALIAALQTRSSSEGGRLKGAALDVFSVEPLPESSPLWSLDNVLLSPHNMDQTDTFMQESTAFFVNNQLPRFVRNLPLYNKVDLAAGY